MFCILNIFVLTLVVMGENLQHPEGNPSSNFLVKYNCSPIINKLEFIIISEIWDSLVNIVKQNTTFNYCKHIIIFQKSFQKIQLNNLIYTQDSMRLAMQFFLMHKIRFTTTQGNSKKANRICRLVKYSLTTRIFYTLLEPQRLTQLF